MCRGRLGGQNGDGPVHFVQSIAFNRPAQKLLVPELVAVGIELEHVLAAIITGKGGLNPRRLSVAVDADAGENARQLLHVISV